MARAKRSSTSRRGPVRVAIIGTGGMANTHALTFKAIPGCELVAAADVDRTRVDAFCARHAIPQAFTDAREMLQRVACDAVSIVTPDATHAPLSLLAIKAGKHVMCEKPLALNHAEAARMLAAARRAGVVHLVNFSYRNWSAIQAVARVVQAGRIGEVRHVEASYLQCWLSSKIWGDWRTSPGWLWRLSTAHGSQGVLGDVGVHIVDFATYPVGPIARVYCQLKTFHKAPRDRVGPYGLDANDSAVLTVEFANGALGSIQATRWSTGHANRLFLKISGTKGAVEIDSERSTSAYRICDGAGVDAAKWREVETKPTSNNHQRFIAAIRKGRAEQPDFARGAEVQKVLDACFASAAKRAPVRI